MNSRTDCGRWNKPSIEIRQVNSNVRLLEQIMFSGFRSSARSLSESLGTVEPLKRKIKQSLTLADKSRDLAHKSLIAISAIQTMYTRFTFDVNGNYLQ